MATEILRDPDFEWLDMLQPTGLVVGRNLLRELDLVPERQTKVQSAEAAAFIEADTEKPALKDPWGFVVAVLGWEARHVAASPDGPPLTDTLMVRLPEHDTTLAPAWAVKELGGNGAQPWQLLVRIETGIDPDKRGALAGWEAATAHQRFERLLRETGVFAGLMVTGKELRLVYAPRGETSGWLSFPIRALATIAGRPMLGGLKLLLDTVRLFTDADERRLAALLKKKPVEAAKTVPDLAAALDAIVDERASPRKHEAASGTPILQPTDERRRTGSHYTPRSLTEPIVRYALEPAFERLGSDATPDQILDLKVCDPAMGSGAFLVEACRTIAAKLVRAWERWPEKKPAIPADEDEDLHARRLVAQRCLYGVDKNPLATDLAKLSLWLATLARDHEFTFLDHALKSGDSLVGLTKAQIAAVNWNTSKPGLPLFRKLIADRVAEAMKGRAEIQAAPDDTARAVQEARHRSLEARLKDIRLMGDAVIAAFFAADKPKAREARRAEVESCLAGSPVAWDKLAAFVPTLKQGAHALTPFHWETEFPEVFGRENAGFDAMVGNPPFAGMVTISTSNRNEYIDWLQALHENAHGNADLVAHFFRRAFRLLRHNGLSGLLATNTIRQGDTRETGLRSIIANGGTIIRAHRRLKWPGEAAVVVCVVHVMKGSTNQFFIDHRSVHRISAYLVDGEFD
jgi:Eco57I restriction-modification methylase